MPQPVAERVAKRGQPTWLHICGALRGGGQGEAHLRHLLEPLGILGNLRESKKNLRPLDSIAHTADFDPER